MSISKPKRISNTKHTVVSTLLFNFNASFFFISCFSCFLEALSRRRELLSTVDGQVLTSTDDHHNNGKYTPSNLYGQGSASLNESIRSTSQISSPNRGPSLGGPGQKFDSTKKTTANEYSQDYPLNPAANNSMSFITLNNSAEKQLNYSKANVSFRQVPMKLFLKLTLLTF